MSVRPGMTLIVAQLRQHGQASTTDEFNGVAYWTDEQLQEIADTYSERLLVKLVPVNSATRTEYSLKAPRLYWYESDTIAVMEISADDTLTTVETARVYNPVRAEIVFSEDLSCQKEYAVQGYATNLNLALAGLWEQKAAQRYDYIDFKAGNNKMNMQQEYDHCLDMVKLYRSRTIKRWSRGGTGRWSA